MKFTQYDRDKETIRSTRTLDIIQQGETVKYEVGNNTYYQFGRKDPQVGFVDRKKNYKANFGPVKFTTADNSSEDITLANGIQHPELMFVNLGSVTMDKCDDWTTQGHINLWNNSPDVEAPGLTDIGDSYWNQIKTIYDPCPVGFMVPNAGIWRMISTSANPIGPGDKHTYKAFKPLFNGERERKIDAIPDGIYVYIAYGTGDKNDKENWVYLVPTGNRWYSNAHTFKEEEKNTQGTTEITEISAGKNFNLRLFYGWSSRWKNTSERAAISVALGIDGASDYNYYIADQFCARRSMGRPVRPIRDYKLTK